MLSKVVDSSYRLQDIIKEEQENKLQEKEELDSGYDKDVNTDKEKDNEESLLRMRLK